MRASIKKHYFLTVFHSPNRILPHYRELFYGFARYESSYITFFRIYGVIQNVTNVQTSPYSIFQLSQKVYYYG